MKVFDRGAGEVGRGSGPRDSGDLADRFADNGVPPAAMTDMHETLDTPRAEPRIVTILGWMVCLAVALYFPVLLRITVL